MNIVRQIWNQFWVWLAGAAVENQADAQVEAYAEARFDELVVWLLDPDVTPEFVYRQPGSSVCVRFRGLDFWFRPHTDFSDMVPAGTSNILGERAQSKGPASRNAKALVLKRWPFMPEAPPDLPTPAEKIARMERCRSAVVLPDNAPTAWSLEQPPDSETGVDTRPARYTSPDGRETIDEMRDQAGVFFSQALDAGCSVDDAVFASHCELDALKYLARYGKKGNEADAAKDRAKSQFYRDMAAHVRNEGPDPRHMRPGFIPYRRNNGLGS